MPEKESLPPRGDLERAVRIYETILSTTDDFAYIFDLQGRFLYANVSLLKVWDKTLDQIVGKTCHELDYPAWHADMHMREIEEVIRTKAPIRGEVPFTGGSGIYGIYDYIFKPVLDEAGNVEVIVGTTRDVTERKGSEEALYRMAAVVESSDDAIIGKTLDGIIRSWNRGAERIFGYTAEEAVGQPIFLLIPKELHEEELSILARLSRGERLEHFETVRLAKGGRKISLSLTVSPIRDASGKIIGASKIARDITEDKKRQEALRESEARFRTMADAAPMLIWEAGPDKLCTYFNQTWLAFVGRSLEQQVGDGWVETLHPDDLAPSVRIYTSAFDARLPFEMEYRVLHHTGEYRWLLGHGAPRFGSQGTFQGYIGASVDITDSVAARQTAVERRQELERLVTERTASLQEAVSQMEEFSYSVSHDLRAPLRAMQGYATAVLEDYGEKLDEEGRAYLQRIISSGSRMDRLTRDVLVYSKIPRSSMPLNPLSLENLVSDIAQQYIRTKTREAEITVVNPLLPVVGNESFLSQAISNLVDNAAKFFSPDRPPRIRIWTEACGDQVRLWVEDNGIGIKPEHQSRIWGMFERVHPQHLYEGTGIGLAIVRKTVEKMNGTMGVISDGFSGSRFWIQLPGI
ncbi:PAS domain S-box-containing protein [Verrucomicrobium sp. GAS474]|uniref:PAS domain S-box protein n=1 Tax=Verrucomicrobium sp. GAS474 TaxID=1882831 RepID=UPI00087A5BAE|nr:PAS domain S-box protein [Verrucomicrobium sp. GAS474]SDU28457.1 PAS domain S-box-containing protein [Verrucomicrobium sp. GAS474]